LNELDRIKAASKCPDYFEELVKGVVKSYIILLTFTSNMKKSPVIEAKYHEHISVANFIHKCYIESARSFYNSPGLFWHKYPPLKVKENQTEIFNIIKNSIKEAIRQMLPMKLILHEFLQNDYMNEEEIINVNITKEDYDKIKYFLDEAKKIEEIKNNTNYAHVYDGGIGINNMNRNNNYKKHNSIFMSEDSSDFMDDDFNNNFNDDPNQINIIKISKDNETIPVNNIKIFDVQSNDVDDIIASQRNAQQHKKVENNNNNNNDKDSSDKDKDNEKIKMEYIRMEEEGNGKKRTNFGFVGNVKNKLAEKYGVVIDNHNQENENIENENNKKEDNHDDRENHFMRYK